MSRIILDVPNESLLALRRTPEAVGSRQLRAAAVKLYELGELSSSATALEGTTAYNQRNA